MNRLLIIIGICSVIILGVWYKIASLNTIISKQKLTITAITTELNTTILKKNNLTLALALEKGDNKNLLSTVDECNANVIKIKTDNATNMKTYMDWANKKAEDKYKAYYSQLYTDTNGTTYNYDSGDCKSGLYLNDVISRIKYEDL